MRAVRFAAFGGPEVLSLDIIDPPVPAPDEVLVKVAYAAIQPFDRRTRQGEIPVPPDALPVITGNEFSGTIAAIGADVTGFAVGDRIAGRRSFGAVADFVAVPAIDIAQVPDGLAMDKAATLSGTAQTADAAVETLAIGPEDRLLVLGAAGGVGSFAVPIARALGASVLGTVAPDNLGYLEALGAIAIASTEDLAEAVAHHAPDGVTAILDCVGGSILQSALKLGLAPDRICSIAEFGLVQKLGLRPLQGVRDGRRLAKLMKLATNGTLPVTVRARYAIEDSVAAHRELDTGHGRGKIVIAVNAP